MIATLSIVPVVQNLPITILPAAIQVDMSSMLRLFWPSTTNKRRKEALQSPLKRRQKSKVPFLKSRALLAAKTPKDCFHIPQARDTVAVGGTKIEGNQGGDEVDYDFIFEFDLHSEYDLGFKPLLDPNGFPMRESMIPLADVLPS